MKRVGILGGMGPQSTVELYLSLLDKYVHKYGNQNYPEIVIFSVNFQKILDLQNNQEKSEYISSLMEGIHSLTEAHVDVVVIAANTPHIVLDELAALSKVPILSIVEATAKDAKKNELKHILLLGTKQTMKANYYQKVFSEKHISLEVPTEQHQELLEDLLSNIDHGPITQNMKNAFKEIITSYEVDGVILGCTEFPLLTKNEVYLIPILDTVDILAKNILEYIQA